jgi:acetyl esterase/lipase
MGFGLDLPLPGVWTWSVHGRGTGTLSLAAPCFASHCQFPRHHSQLGAVDESEDIFSASDASLASLVAADENAASDFQRQLSDLLDGESDEIRPPPVLEDDGVRVIPDIPYRDDKTLHKHQLDVYIQQAGAESASRPVVIHFHGGGWKRGDRQNAFYGSPAMCRAYAASGFVAVGPSYRLGQSPNHLEDATAAVMQFATRARAHTVCAHMHLDCMMASLSLRKRVACLGTRRAHSHASFRY